ncbi:MAG TPA: MerR family transcriptional regulator [Dehalococcoidia bacterium]|nr:MerR family transcriptional regulator [Dehalococcoidia bacterium]
MPVIINTQTYYRTAEVCQMVGISRNTLFRWFKEGISKEAQHRDRRGWRLFTEDEINRLKMEVNQINKLNNLGPRKG